MKISPLDFFMTLFWSRILGISPKVTSGLVLVVIDSLGKEDSFLGVGSRLLTSLVAEEILASFYNI